MSHRKRSPLLRPSAAIACCLFACLTAGCEAPPYYKCEGVVTHDGKPVADLQITFMPVIVDSVRSPVGLSDSEGKFEMTTARFRGVPPGEYKIFVEDPVAADGRHTSKEAGYLYVTSQYCELNSDLKYVANKHRTDFELKLDTRTVAADTNSGTQTTAEDPQKDSKNRTTAEPTAETIPEAKN